MSDLELGDRAHQIQADIGNLGRVTTSVSDGRSTHEHVRVTDRLHLPMEQLLLQQFCPGGGSGVETKPFFQECCLTAFFLRNHPGAP